MPIRIVKQQVMVYRDGKFVYPPVGERYEFTSDEVADINKANPKALQVIEAPADPEPVAAKVTPKKVG